MKERPTTALGKWKRDLYPNIKYWKFFFILFSISFARGRQGILKGNRLERIESTRKTQRGSVTSRPGNKGAWFSQGSHYEGYSEEVFITGVLPQNQTKRPRKRHRKYIGPLVPSTATANALLRERSLLKRSVFASLFGSCYVLCFCRGTPMGRIACTTISWNRLNFIKIQLTETFTLLVTNNRLPDRKDIDWCVFFPRWTHL